MKKVIIIAKIQTNDKLSREMGYFIDRRKRKVRERGDGSRVHDASCLAASEKPASDKY